MELKVQWMQLRTIRKQFQSHLYGIESCGIRKPENNASGFNRTFMELKEKKLNEQKLKAQFQSHLYGIEREVAQQRAA